MSRSEEDRSLAATPLYDDIKYPGNGYPIREMDRLEPLSPWGRMMRGQALGKKTILNYDATSIVDQPAPVNLFDLRGLDIDACQLQVTLNSPLAIPRAEADLGIDIQNQTGEFTSQTVGSADYPGELDPIAWPPIVAILRWGVQGARAEAVVDFVNGTVINVPCSSIDVFAAIPPDAIHAPGTSGAYVVSAFVGPGRPRDGNAQRTIYLGQIANGDESDVFVVPAFAKRATLIGCDSSGGVPAVTVGYLRFWQRPDGARNVGNYIVSGNQPGPFNVPNAGAYFTVVSQMSVTALYAVCFELAI